MKTTATGNWIWKVEEINKNEYAQSAKNPNRIKTIEYPKPEELHTSIAQKEKEIENILIEIHQVLSKK